MRIQKISIILGIVFSLTALPLYQGFASSGQKTVCILDEYVGFGLENNLALKQRVFSLKKSLKALDEAKGMFLPSVSIESRYSRAGGGRIIEFPVGDMVNPIHLTLNQLLAAQGQSPSFPANIQNVEIPFLREEEHDTKLRVVQPVFQPSVYFNIKMKKKLSKVEKAKVATFERQLTADIKTAYYNYLQSIKIMELLKETHKMLVTHLQISQSLFKNHKRTEEVVFRAEAELSQVLEKIAEAQKNKQMTAAYFNFLLNRPLDTAIKGQESRMLTVNQNNFLTNHKDLAALQEHALKYREEFMELFNVLAATGQAVKLHKSAILPTVSAVFDYGFQGETYRFTKKDDYWMASLVFEWNLFNGGQDKAKKRQAQIELKRLKTQQQELESQIKMQVKQAFLDMQVAQFTITSTRKRHKATEESFYIISKKYEQGMVPQIEFLKAQNDLTKAGINKIIAQFELHKKIIRLKRVTAI